MKFLYFAILFFQINSIALSKTVIDASNIKYLTDPARTLNIETIKTLSESEWYPLEDKGINFGFRKEAFWFKISLPKCKNKKVQLLEISYPILDNIEVWFFRADSSFLKSYKTGDRIPFKNRPIHSSYYYFPISCNTESMIMKIDTESSVQAPLRIMSYSEYRKAVAVHDYVHMLYFGAAFMIAGYNLLLFAVVRRLSYLYYVAFVLSFATFQASISGLGFQFIWGNIPDINKHMQDKSVCMIVLFGSLFTKTFLKSKRLSPKFDKIYSYLLYILAVYIAVSFYIPYIISIKISLSFVVIVISFIIFLLIKSFRKRQREGYIYSVSWLFFLSSSLLVVFNKLGIIPSSILTDYSQLLGSTLEMLLLSFGLADQVNTLRKDLRISNTKLNQILHNIEQVVIEKTRDIKAILNHITQGILTFKDDEVILPEYSNHLEEILEVKQIAGKTLEEALLSKSSLSNEQLDQIREAIELSIGNDKINFAANSHLFPQELTFKNMKSPKILDADWNPIYDNGDIVTKFILTLRDVTRIKELVHDAETQKTEFKIISQIIPIKDDFYRIFSECLSLYESSKLSLDRNQETDKKIESIFQDLHTLKGISRTSGLSMLSELVHDVESYFDQSRKDHSLFDKEKGRENILHIGNLLDLYDDVATNKLALNSAHQSIGRDQIAEISVLLKSDTKTQNKLNRIANLVDEMANDFGFTLNKSLQRIVEQSVTKAAKFLKKPIPHMKITGTNHIITKSQLTLLEKVLVHLTTNSLDHGIESPEERRRKNKDEQGMIIVEAQVRNDSVYILFFDDGQGLNIDSLRKKGLKKHFIEESASDLEVGRLIFNSNMSTADQITELSGRGVGLNSVRTMLTEINGEIDIQPNNYLDKNRVGFVFKIRFPLINQQFDLAQ